VAFAPGAKTLAGIEFQKSEDGDILKKSPRWI